MNGAPLRALETYLIVLGIQRAHELWFSSRNERRLRARGAIEHGRRHFPLLVALHVLFPVLLVTEILAGGARPPSWWPVPLALLIGAEALRLWSMAALGEYWTARVFIVAEMPRVRRGPYQWIAHPSYAAATIELLAGPLMFGAWRTAIALTVLNAAALTLRVRSESRALTAARR